MAPRPILINIQGDDSQLKKVLKGAAGRVEGFAKKIGKIGVQSGKAIGAATAATGVASTKMFMDFEQGMNEVFTLLPKAGQETYDELTRQTKEFSKEFGVLPDKVIPSLYDALSAGVPSATVFDYLEVAQKMARGGNVELTESLDGLTTATNAWSTMGLDATEAADIFATTVRLGKTTVGELSSELSKAGPLAAAAGVSFADIGAATATLTASGEPTAVAMTKIKSALAELMKSGTKSSDALKEMSGFSFQELIGQGKSLQEIFQLMADQSDGGVLDLFSSIEAGSAVLALTAGGGQAFADATAEFGNSAGATEAAFDRMNQGLKVNFDKIKANLAVLSIEIGSRIAPFVVKATDFMVKAFENLEPNLKKARKRLKELFDTVKGFVVPIFDRAREIFGLVAEKVLEVWDAIYNYLAPGIKDLADKVTDLAERAFGKLVEIFNAIDFNAVFNAIATGFETARAKAMEFIRDIPNKFREFKDFIDRNKDALIVFGGAIAGVAAAWALYQIKLKLVAAWTTAVGIAQKALDAIMKVSVIGVITVALFALVGALIAAYYRFERVREIVDNVIDFFQHDFVPMLHDVKDNVIEMKDKVVAAFIGIKDYLDMVFGPAISVVIGMVVETFQFMKEQIKLVIDLVRAIFDGDWKEATHIFAEMVGNAIGFIVGFFTKLPGRLLKALPPIIFALKDIAKAFAQFLLEKVGRIMDKIVDFFIALPKKLLDAGIQIASALLEMGVDFGKKIIDGIVEGLRRAGGAIKDFIMTLIPDVGDIVDSVVGGAKSLGKKALGVIGFADGGIVTKPTLGLVGEAGPEAIIPLSKAGAMGTVVNINVNTGVGDPVAIGDEVVEVLTAWQRANGQIPLDTSAA
jgi:TP901 family phage tail tape measure protein